MLQFKKYEDITHWVCGVYRAHILALKRNSRNHRMVCGRHGCARTDFYGTLIGPTATTYLWYHPGSLLWSIWLWGLVPQSGYFQIKITVFSFSNPLLLTPVVDSVLASDCVFCSHARLCWMRWLSSIPCPTHGSSL